jgi:hypothetical protein
MEDSSTQRIAVVMRATPEPGIVNVAQPRTSTDDHLTISSSSSSISSMAPSASDK